MLIRKLQGTIEKQKGIYYEYDVDSSPIGEGGMGVVYRGFCIDEKTGLRTEVAIKALHDDLPEEVYARAEREASIQLRHDNLVEMLGLISLYEINQWGEKVFHHYVISEFLHGIELSDLLIGKLDGEFGEDNAYARVLYNDYLIERERTSIKVIREILSGVLALHDKGYIHRDIDPSNVMVTNDGHVKLIDFGIAKNLKALGSNDKLRTATGKFIGKAEYASPELVLGDVKSQNYTTDIYALGILLYRLLVGQLPFTGSQYEVLQHQLKSKVPVKNIKNVALAKVVKKATEKLQRRRYTSIAEFRVAIDYAECSRNSVWNEYRKYSIVCMALVAIGVGIWRTMDLATKEDNPIAMPLYQQFDKAVFLLDSNISDSVNLGFRQMLELANADYDSAKVEVGITYFPSSQSSLINKRRACLHLNNDTKYSANKIIGYLSSVEDKSVLSPEAYYILGAAYLWNEKYKSTLDYFKMALQQLDDGKKTSHGYDANDLKMNIKENIDIVRKMYTGDE